MDFLGSKNFAGVHFPGIENLASQGHDRLKFTVTGLFRGAAGGVTLNQKEFRAVGVAAGTIRQFSGQSRTGCDLLAGHFLAGPETTLGIADEQFSECFSNVRVLIQPQTERVLHHTGNKRGGFPGGQTFLGLAGKLGFLHLEGQHIGAAFPDAPGQQVAELAELPHGLQQAGTQAVHMGAALGGRNQVNVTLHNRFATFRQPLERPVHRFLVAGKAARERLQRYGFDVGKLGAQVVPQTALVAPFIFITGVFLQESDVQAGTENGLGAQVVAQTADGKFRAVEVAWVRGELQSGTGVPLAHRVDNC